MDPNVHTAGDCRAVPAVEFALSPEIPGSLGLLENSADAKSSRLWFILHMRTDALYTLSDGQQFLHCFE